MLQLSSSWQWHQRQLQASHLEQTGGGMKDLQQFGQCRLCKHWRQESTSDHKRSSVFDFCKQNSKALSMQYKLHPVDIAAYEKDYPLVFLSMWSRSKIVKSKGAAPTSFLSQGWRSDQRVTSLDHRWWGIPASTIAKQTAFLMSAHHWCNAKCVCISL